ncbi:MAG: class I poly(R)-hydroxyalkanoic acid synthase [Agarilytica sp.]
MNAKEKHQILDYVNKYTDVFNDMMGEVTKRMIKHDAVPDLASMLQKGIDEQDFGQYIKIDPKKFIQQQYEFLQKQKQLWENASQVFMGADFAPVIAAEPGDKRFKDEDWEDNPAFKYIKQAYLLNAEYLNQMVESMEFENKQIENQVHFYTRQFINSVAPTNYLLTNPEVCREILETKGQNLAKGIDNFRRDLERSPQEAFKVTQVASDAFALGKELAKTPGEVVFKNELIELIQYKAETEQVRKIPLLIVPPFINKFYILDLDEKKSMVRWLVSQGYTVFMVSWVNPDESYRHIPFDDYINKGVIAAIEAASEISSSKNVNAVGYCVGGTVLAMAAAYMKQVGDERVNSLTLLTTLLDFSEPGEVGTYLTNYMVPMLEQSVISKGYLDGRILAMGFSLLRENNLFWSFFIENYLKGKDPMPFDILYWNSDSTNLPADAYLYYLKNMYLENNLVQPGKIEVNGTPIDVQAIQLPTYCLAAQADHIVIWGAAHKSAKYLGDDVRFVLTESGHVAGVINPADKTKYSHWVNDNASTDANDWFAGAAQKGGSWWLDWHEWLSERSGSQVKARKVGKLKKYPALGDAPGEYVLRRLDDI